MFLLILACLAAFTVGNVQTRTFQLHVTDGYRRVSLHQSLYCLIAALCFGLSGKIEMPSTPTVLYGIAFGVFFFLASFCSARCYECGSMALTSIIGNLSLILPVLYSILFAHEKLKLPYFFGILLFIVSFFLSSGAGVKGEKINVKWCVFVLINFISNGSSAIVQKNYVSRPDGTQTALFMAIAYLTSAVLFLIDYLRRPETKHLLPCTKKDIGKLFLLSALAGVGSYGGNYLLAYLSTPVDGVARVSGVILYPCINGGLCLVMALCSFLFLREKPTKRKWLAIAVGLVAIVVLNVF